MPYVAASQSVDFVCICKIIPALNASGIGLFRSRAQLLKIDVGICAADKRRFS